MNWYSVFYWLSVADGVKTFFDYFSNIATLLWVVSSIIFVLTLAVGKDISNPDDKEKFKYWITFSRRLWLWLSTITIITWTGYVFTPSKRDCYVIVAGGAVGQFLSSDSAAQKLPSEALQLLRDKIREESKEITLLPSKDTLATKTKEELIKIIQDKK